MLRRDGSCEENNKGGGGAVIICPGVSSSVMATFLPEVLLAIITMVL